MQPQAGRSVVGCYKVTMEEKTRMKTNKPTYLQEVERKAMFRMQRNYENNQRAVESQKARWIRRDMELRRREDMFWLAEEQRFKMARKHAWRLEEYQDREAYAAIVTKANLRCHGDLG
jgi:uncharacterized protein YjcR